MTSVPAPRPRSRRIRPSVLAFFGVAVVLLLAPAWMGAVGSAPLSLRALGANGLTTTSTNNTCQCVPEALYITNQAPKIGVTTSDLLNVTYEWEIPTYHPWFGTTLIHIPSIVVNFTLIKNPNIVMLFPQRNETIAGPGWSNASLATDSKVLSSHFFFSSKLAYLSTQRIAVMANVSYGTFKLEFRWQWSVYKPNLNTTYVGNWSNSTEGVHHQDLITPAPLVFLSTSTVRTLALGSTFIAQITGLVANQGKWLLEMEYPNGSVTTQQNDWGPNGTATYFNASLPMETYTGRLTPGMYLVHVHTPHGGIVFSITVHLFAPTTAVVNVGISPETCGPITINGTAYASGSTPSYPTGPVTLSAPSCPGQPFHDWTQKGGGLSFTKQFAATTNATLYYNTTLTATYT
jgi:hypothetical protein